MKVDIIGDVHGCLTELLQLINKLGYLEINGQYSHPDQRSLIFVGDITDRGPASIKTINLVYRLVYEDRVANYAPGNHCNKLYRYFLGNNVQAQHGLETTIAELERLTPTELQQVKEKFIQLYKDAPLYLDLPLVNAVVAHAGIKEQLIGRHDKKTRSFVLYGDTTGEKLPDGRPVRRDWAKAYAGDKWIVYGHTPVWQPRFLNKTVNIDLGCVFGNKLAAFRLPEEVMITVDSQQALQKEKFTIFNDE
ncbi:bis(5'-nucleosyl)-tetraphosphatase (symmetrical) [Amphibacillus marinus]|uniref:Bis(5'-nucleosyl)-tetraphosphatase (Symmetrical) n=1 Tax=Amphibacillus marinus TaxID=872970 RepID=A0A1H8QA65_9BACI|nr:bis(5'-nucleosyl)-tetraphosphatase PrpE [Amphibacillus marinus]SEO51122.1 bis(5'-nucleosyl)-tetraphosphatase (symmetrical) [Amphibacillus marinus]